MTQQFYSQKYIKKKKKRVREETLIWKDACIPVFIGTLFAMAQVWKQPGCPLTDVNG